MNLTFRADLVFDGQRLHRHKLVMADQSGFIIELLEDDGRKAEKIPGILSPGFINAHCHIELSHLKDVLPRHTGLVDFVQNIIKRRFTASEAEKQMAMQAACKSMLNAGIVAVGDISNTADSIACKKAFSRVHFKNFIEVSGFVPGVAQQRFDAAKSVKNSFLSAGLNATIVPHAPYSVSRNLFKLISKESNGEIISIHNQEAPDEDLFLIKKQGDFLKLYATLGIDISSFSPTGKTSFATWRELLNKPKAISVHNTFTPEKDMLYEQELWYCLCPNANLYIENCLPPLYLLRSKVDNICIGTDSLASNDRLDMLSEIGVIKQHFSDITDESLLKWITLNGAKALGIAETFGSLEPGKRPGLVQVSHNLTDSALLLL